STSVGADRDLVGASAGCVGQSIVADGHNVDRTGGDAAGGVDADADDTRTGCDVVGGTSTESGVGSSGGELVQSALTDCGSLDVTSEGSSSELTDSGVVRAGGCATEDQTLSGWRGDRCDGEAVPNKSVRTVGSQVLTGSTRASRAVPNTACPADGVSTVGNQELTVVAGVASAVHDTGARADSPAGATSQPAEGSARTDDELAACSCGRKLNVSTDSHVGSTSGQVASGTDTNRGVAGAGCQTH
ncbi:MAG: hypothetical protein EBU90_30480, partial [Proteobacteria bacterium]|nr:hypothetical protein [Pseudomonadota bacterium]